MLPNYPHMRSIALPVMHAFPGISHFKNKVKTQTVGTGRQTLWRCEGDGKEVGCKRIEAYHACVPRPHRGCAYYALQPYTNKKKFYKKNTHFSTPLNYHSKFF